MTMTYRCEYVRCGKKGCKGCPHGPYWYGYWKEDGKLHKKYFGKQDPREKKKPKAESVTQEIGDPRDAIFNRRTASRELAHRILGTSYGMSKGKCEAAYKMLVMMNHPDRGGDKLECQYITAAWSFLKAEMGW